MTNFQVYKKVLPFSLVMFAVDLLSVAIFVGCCVGGFFLFNSSNDMGLLGIVIGAIVAIAPLVLISIFLSNRFKAAQISMMVKGVTEDSLPEHTFKAGMEELKGRFGKITAFYFLSRAIKNIFRQLGHMFNKIGTAVGGNTGDAVTSVINSGVETLISYCSDCCLGWILYRKEVAGPKAGCEGAVIFFKHGKTLMRNIGRIFGMSLLSFVVVGGAFFGIFYLVFASLPQVFANLASEVSEFAVRNSIDIPSWVSDPTLFTVLVAAIGAIVLWSILHSVLGRPFILTGVMRNFMKAGLKDIPTEADFAILDSKSAKFAKLHSSI